MPVAASSINYYANLGEQPKRDAQSASTSTAPATDPFAAVTPPAQNVDTRQAITTGPQAPVTTPEAPQEAAAKPAAAESKIADGTGMGTGVAPSPEVKELQESLLKVNGDKVREIHNKHYGDRGPEGVEKVLTDGKYGKATAESVAATREMLGLSRDGGVTQEFLDKLKEKAASEKTEETAPAPQATTSPESTTTATTSPSSPAGPGAPTALETVVHEIIPTGAQPVAETAAHLAGEYPTEAAFAAGRTVTAGGQAISAVANTASKTPLVGGLVGGLLKLPAGVSRLAGRALYPVAASVEAYNAYQEGIKEHPEDTTRAYVKAGGAATGALAGIAAATWAGALVGTTVGTAVPVAGNIVGAVVGAGVGLGIGIFTVWAGAKAGGYIAEGGYDDYRGK